MVWLTSGSPGSKPEVLSAWMRVPRLMPGESAWVLIALPRQQKESRRLDVRERDSGRGFWVTWEGK